MRASRPQPGRASVPYKAIVIGGSAGGVAALEVILGGLPPDFRLPILVVQHLHLSDGGGLARHLARVTRLSVVEPCDKARIEPGHVYVAPANYHMLVERGGTVALSIDEKVNWSRPSLDVLFESAARAWGKSLIAIILSGANADGALGAATIKAWGGLVIAQDPTEAEHLFMPQAAINTGAVDQVLRSQEIGRLVMALA